MDTRPQARLRQQQAQQHQDQSQQRPAVAARRAQNRQRERFSLGLTMANPAQPESIVTNKSAAARLSGVLLYVLLLHCCTAVLGGGCWVVGGWWTATRPLREMAEYRQKRNSPPSVSCFIQDPQEPTSCAARTRCTAVRIAALLSCCL